MIFLKDLLISILFMSMGALNHFMCTMYIQELDKARRGPQVPRARVTGNCEAPMWLLGSEFVSSARHALFC